MTLIRKPDNPGIIAALNKVGGKVDLCHYDSDKSWWGRHYAYSILWKSLNSRACLSLMIFRIIFIFLSLWKKLLNFAVIEFEGKFVGLIRKE